MSARAFSSPEAKQQTVAAIKEVESRTSAELVVAVRKQSGSYRHADYLFGFLLALSAFSTAMAIKGIPPAAPLDLALLFLIGAGICAYVPWLRRVFAGPGLLRANVAMAARSAFVEMGISRTAARGGVLVYISMLERRVEVVPDIGLNLPLMGEEWTGAVRELQHAVRRGDLSRFVAGLNALGPILAKHYPHLPDDRNELPDEVSSS